MSLPVRREQTEEGGAEEHAGDHFADDRRLAKATDQPAHGFAGTQDDGELEEKADG